MRFSRWVPALALAAVSFVTRPAAALSLPSPGAISPTTLKLPDGPASVRGLDDGASVDTFDGQLTYAVPIEVPAGPGGLKPHLSVAYSGALGNGAIGVGFALGGVAIQRSLRHGVPSYDDSIDELELVGLGKSGRLVPISDGTFRVEGHGQGTKVVRSGNGFVVTTHEGTRYVLGTGSGAQQAAKGRVAAWLLEAAIDLAGQRIDYAYTIDRGQTYLASIAWAPAFHVDLAYAARPDVVTSYRTGWEVTTASRLASIRVSASNDAIRTYALAYDDTLPLSRLSGVTMTGHAGATGWPALHFSYGGPQPATMTALGNVGGWVLNTRGVALADVDGDGRSDLLRVDAAGHSYRRNLGNGSFADAVTVPNGNGVDLSTSRLVDLDGDMRPELTYVIGTTWRVRALSGASWVAPFVWNGTSGEPMFGSGVTVADVNGDGRADMLRQSMGNLYVHFATAGGFGPSIPVTPIDAPNNVTLGTSSVRTHDVNGDGLADVVYLTDSWMKVYFGVGDGSFTAGSIVAYPWPATAVAPAATHLADLNRDGVADLVRFINGNMEWYRGKPNLTFDGTPVKIARPDSADYDAVVAVADMNGNGSDDVVWSSPRGMWILDLSGPTTFAMLSRIDNGLGKTTSFEYTATGDLEAKDEAAGKPWSVKPPIAIPVPVRMVTQTGAGDPARAVTFTVRDGFYDVRERRFGGFLGATERAESLVAATVQTVFEQGLDDRRVLRGQPLSLTTFDEKGAIVLQKTFTRDTVAIAALGTSPLARVGFVRDETETRFEGLAHPVAVRTEYVVDALGRVLEEHHLGRLDLAGDETTAFRTFADDDTTWVRDAIVYDGTKDASGQVVRERRHTYGDDVQLLPLGVVGKGWSRKTESRLADATRGEVWIDDDETKYDAKGNVVAKFDGKAWHARVYDANGLYVLQERVTTGTRALVWTASWDEKLGVPVRMSGPNGEPTFLSYDGFGRLTGRGHAQGLPFVVYAYDWSAPRPRTTVYQFEGAESALKPFVGWSAGSGWRESDAFTNGGGERAFVATRLASGQYAIHHWVTRDDQGRVVFEAEPFFATALPPAVPIGTPGHATTYDALGRTTATVLPTGSAKRTRYAAFEVASTTDDLAPVTTRLDGLGRVLHTERTIGATVESVDALYDVTGSITKLRLQGGAVEHAYAYDSLGRLVATLDPDNGARKMAWNDLHELVSQTNAAGQIVDYTYDDIGRVTKIHAADGTAYVYHYDAAKDGTTSGNTLGRVAWIEEPTGEVDFAYDVDGREARVRRIVSGRSVEVRHTHAPTGPLLAVSYDDGFGFDVGYDDAGRMVRVGSYWQALALDARGAVAQERFGNGVVETYQRDAIGQPSHLRIERPTHAAIYDVAVTRNRFGGITSVQDGDGVGLDHTATFAYDGAGRLVQALLGAGASQFAFVYGYDGLQNMVSRGATGPKALDVAIGTYVYGENGRSPRQLTHVRGASATVDFDYDAAGRVTREANISMTYDGFDELLAVTQKNAQGVVQALAQHAYGYDGLRVSTKGADGSVKLWLSADVTEHGGVREHAVEVGGRTVAKVSVATSSLPPPSIGSLAAPPQPRVTASGGTTSDADRSKWALPFALFGVLVLLAMLSARGVRKRFASAVLATIVLASAACSSGGSNDGRTDYAVAAWSAGDIVYFHQGFAAGPVAFTGAAGAVLEERRYEPFGAPIDAYKESGGVGSIGNVDFAREPTNGLAKETDPSTGLSYHGARWMAPQLARWLTPDPPTKAPDPRFLLAPWDLNPYSYVRSNPLLYWDPDGRDWQSFGTGLAVGFAKGFVTAVAIAAVATVAPVAGTVIGVGMLAYGAYQLYEGRHEIAALGQRIADGKTTDADHAAIGEMIGGYLGGKAGAPVGVLAGGAIKAALPSVPKPPPAPTGLGVRSGVKAGAGSRGGKANGPLGRGGGRGAGDGSTRDVVTANGQRAAPDGTRLGPSGKKEYHYSNSATRKGAVDGARAQGGGQIEKDVASVKQPPHWHAVGESGERVSGPGKTHFNVRGSSPKSD